MLRPFNSPKHLCQDKFSGCCSFEKKLGLRLSSYLDDWLILNKVQDLLLRDINTALNLLSQLGWIVNKEKSQLVPCQLVIYLGSPFDLQNGLVFPTQERINKLKYNCKRLHDPSRTDSFLSRNDSECEVVYETTELYYIVYRSVMRPIKLHLLKHWKPTPMPMSNQNYSTACSAFKLVVTGSEHCQGQIFKKNDLSSDTNHRCKRNIGLGWSFKQSQLSSSMVSSGKDL